MNQLILALNSILQDWKKEYDLFHVISSEFIEKNSFLYFDDRLLCKLGGGLTLQFAMFDPESIQLSLSQDCSIVVAVSWPEDLPPVVSSVSLVHHLVDLEPVFAESAD